MFDELIAQDERTTSKTRLTVSNIINVIRCVLNGAIKVSHAAGLSSLSRVGHYIFVIKLNFKPN